MCCQPLVLQRPVDPERPCADAKRPKPSSLKLSTLNCPLHIPSDLISCSPTAATSPTGAQSQKASGFQSDKHVFTVKPLVIILPTKTTNLDVSTALVRCLIFALGWIVPGFSPTLVLEMPRSYKYVHFHSSSQQISTLSGSARSLPVVA